MWISSANDFARIFRMALARWTFTVTSLKSELGGDLLVQIAGRYSGNYLSLTKS